MEMITLLEFPGRRSHNRFMHPEDEYTPGIEVFIKEIKYPVLQVSIEIDDYVPAYYEIEFR